MRLRLILNRLTAVFWLTLLGCTTSTPTSTPLPITLATPLPTTTPTLPSSTLAAPISTATPLSETATAPPPAATAVPTLPPATLSPATLPPPDPAAIANNKHLLYYSASDGHYYRVGSDGQNPERLTLEPHSGHAMQDLIEQALLDFGPPRVSPNGRYLLHHFGLNPWAVLEVPTRQIVATGRSDMFFAPTWAPDSERFVYIKNNRQLCIVTVASQSEECLWESDEDLFGAAWSPNGRLIAVAKNQPGCCVGEIWLIDTISGESFRGESFEGTLEPTVNSIFKWLPDGNGLLIYALPEGGAAILYPDERLTVRIPNGARGFAPNGRYFYTGAGQLVDAEGTWEHQISDPLACSQGILRRQHAWSPDSSRIAVVAACDDSEELFAGEWTLQMIETASGTLLWEKKLTQTFGLLDWSADGTMLILRHRTTGWPKDSTLHLLAANGLGEPQPLVSGAIFLGSYAPWLRSEAGN
ncbi:MAG: hypothetical protein AAF614_12175 [Chloroflexota bacterium]